MFGAMHRSLVQLDVKAGRSRLVLHARVVPKVVPVWVASMDLLTVREARDQLYRLIDDVAEHHKPIVITGKRNDAVLISKEDWDAIQETLYLSGIPGMVESIQTAASEPIEDCVAFEDLEW